MKKLSASELGAVMKSCESPVMQCDIKAGSLARQFGTAPTAKPVANHNNTFKPV